MSYSLQRPPKNPFKDSEVRSGSAGVADLHATLTLFFYVGSGPHGLDHPGSLVCLDALKVTSGFHSQVPGPLSSVLEP